MRIQGNQAPGPLDRQGSVKKGESAKGGQRASRSANTPSPRSSGAIHKAAEALARDLQTSGQERPGAQERAAQLLSEPFDASAARETALRLLVGERSPGDGRSLDPDA